MRGRERMLVTSPATFHSLSASSAGFRPFAVRMLLLLLSRHTGRASRPPAQLLSRPLDAPAAARELPAAKQLQH